MAAELERELPPATLLCGPRGVGKRDLVEHLIQFHRVHAADVLTCPTPFAVGVARTVITFVGTAALGRFKLVHADLAGASDAALNALLTTLEAPPGSARFVLTATHLPLATIVSRCAVYQLGLPSVDSPSVEVDDTARAAAITLSRAIATGDRDLFDRAARSVDVAARNLLMRLLVEAYTGRWCVFAPADAFGLERTRVRDMISALHHLPAARARLNVRTALHPFVTHQPGSPR